MGPAESHKIYMRKTGNCRFFDLFKEIVGDIIAVVGKAEDHLGEIRDMLRTLVVGGEIHDSLVESASKKISQVFAMGSDNKAVPNITSTTAHFRFSNKDIIRVGIEEKNVMRAVHQEVTIEKTNLALLKNFYLIAELVAGYAADDHLDAMILGCLPHPTRAPHRDFTFLSPTSERDTVRKCVISLC